MAIDELRYTIGVDLGKERNHTALTVVKREWHRATVAEFIASGSRAYDGEYRYTLVGAERLALGTPYPKVVRWVKMLAAPYGDLVGTIVVDASGVGSAVMDEFKKADFGVRLQGVVITGEQASGPPPGGGGGGLKSQTGFRTVSRVELLTKLQVAVQGGQFQVDRPKVKEWEALRREISLLRMDRKSPGQDDLALALALAVWWGVR